ncbi:S8 family peptidase [Mesorhizobium sp. M1423]|uniref:S8 family peptidase n=1 Tax=Mesorhizobium sp. M1423 TaxID=2957101 RepID=UPI0033398FC9
MLDDLPADDPAMARLYLTMPTENGMRQLLAMWRRFETKLAPREDEKDWWKIFGYLSKIRVWNATDRIEPATQLFIDRRMARDAAESVRLELDLWFHEDESVRMNAKESLEGILAAIGGRIVDFVTIEPIRYQVALIEVPAQQAVDVRSRTGALANADQVMSIRPQSLYSAAPLSEPIESEQNSAQGPVQELRPAVAAILDGYPMQNHALLAGRVDVVEVDITGDSVPVERRFHGTAIASLVLHGDLANGEDPLTRRLKVVPVLAAPQHLNDERTREDLLPLGVIYRAVVALKEDDGLFGPSGPDVLIINHSLCDAEGPFVRRPTPWAKLLDWLSEKYGILFVVSAGNITGQFPSGYSDHASFNSAAPLERQIALLRAVEASKGMRSLLSPAEAMTALSVGAVHADGAGDCPSEAMDPFSAVGVTNIGSAIGPGINRALKPDIVEAGGRQVANASNQPAGHHIWPSEIGHIGLKAAAPDPFTGSSSKTRRSTGTSNAAALVTRAGVRIIDALEEVLAEDGTALRDFSRASLATRTLLVHGARWGDAGTLLEAAYPPPGLGQWRRRRGIITKFLGYGRPSYDQVIEGASNRVTLLADDEIRHEQLHEYRVPIPTSMVRSREIRRITMTLSWMPPMHPTSIAYRGVTLDVVDQAGQRKFWRGVKTIMQPHPDDMRRGTCAHFILEGNNSTAFVDSNGLFIGVQARALNAHFHQSSVPYALAVTLEVAPTVQEDIYASVRNAIRPRPRVRA